MRLLFIMNPSSGRTSNDEAVAAINATLEEWGFTHRIFHTTGENDEQLISGIIEEFTPEILVACGGDGTVQLAAKILINKNILLGILPLGSANGLAKALNIPEKINEALDLIVRNSHHVPLDLLRVNDQICVHLSDIGINALLVKSYEESGDKGMLGYAKHLMPSIRESELMRYTIITPEGTFHEEGYMLMIANANRYGTGVKISDGSVSDGKFEICNVKEVNFPSAVKAGLTALNVFVDREMFSDVISCTQAEIKIDRKVHFQVDGEYLGETDHIQVKILPAALGVIVNE
jgi:YegS/Rv2252/BmrU family lipid kinase